MWYLLFLLIFAKGGASLEFAVVRSTPATIACLVGGAGTIAGIRLWRRRQGRRLRPSFDAVPARIESLNLSEAVN
jgi:hypothetical protein